MICDRGSVDPQLLRLIPEKWNMLVLLSNSPVAI